jgi:hypothetical protein
VGQQPGSNQPVEITATELGPLYKLAIEQHMKPPRSAGEIAIAEWLTDELRHIEGPALVVYENGRVPAMLAREGVVGTVAVATTRNLLELAQREGIIQDAEALWARIVQAAPTANPAPVLTLSRADSLSTRRSHGPNCPSRDPPLFGQRDFRDKGR